MKFKGTLRAPRISMELYRQILHAELSDAIAQAAFLWLNAVLMEIPVWSGASHATFLRLAREVGYALTISPSAVSRVPFGQRLSEGEVIADRVKGRYVFRYSTDLPHLIYNEFNNANVVSDGKVFARLIRPGPYGFQEKGKAAFKSFAAGVRLPSPWKALKVKTYKV